jgi:hypothetical protein
MTQMNTDKNHLRTSASSADRLSNRQQMAVDCIQLNDYRLAQSRVRHAVTEHNPPIALARHVDRFVVWPMQDSQGANAGIVALNAARTA